MLSGTSFFNPEMFRKNLSRVWPVWALYAVVWLLMLPVTMWNELSWTYADDLPAWRADFAANNVRNIAVNGGAIVGIIFAAVIACFMFSHLYSARSAGMVASLPVKRTGVFFSGYLAGLVILVSGPVIAFLIGAGIEAGFGCANMGVLFSSLGAVLIQAVLFYSFGCLCAMLTGNAAVMIIAYFILNFTATVLEALIRRILEYIIYGLAATGDYIFTILSPAVEFLDSGMDINWAVYFIYLGAAAACVIGALLLYRRRKMETASEVVAIKALKPVFKYCFAFGCGIVLGSGLYSVAFNSFMDSNRIQTICLGGCILLCCAVGYFMAEMMIQKSFRVFDRWKGCAVICAAMLVIIMATGFDIFGVERYVPGVEDVESVSINGDTVLSERENVEKCLALHHRLIEEKNIGAGGQELMRVSVTYSLKNGKTVSRRYETAVDWENTDSSGTTENLLYSAINSPEGCISRYDMDDSDEVIYGTVYLNVGDVGVETELLPSQMREMYNSCIIPDMEDGNLGWWYWGVISEEYYSEEYSSCNIVWSAMDENDQVRYYYLTVSKNALRTVEYLEKLGVELR